ncbi:helix-turn-helix domain-containing protein [Marinivivus vitaminiproducens]|uniref:helix-turn-helix domain-containing protein n=1 Tax=Marinivivus vitaminiproducens TaxID=3035935 RepID=UPI00279DF27C|nr:helix-turn-helix domain-containing protein [Geminicoccaceae bacterium SCSIO 64248]
MTTSALPCPFTIGSVQCLLTLEGAWGGRGEHGHGGEICAEARLQAIARVIIGEDIETVAASIGVPVERVLRWQAAALDAVSTADDQTEVRSDHHHDPIDASLREMSRPPSRFTRYDDSSVSEPIRIEDDGRVVDVVPLRHRIDLAERPEDADDAARLTSSITIRPAYSVSDFCASFGLGRSKVYEEIAAGRLHSFKIGRRTLIAGDEGLRWLKTYRDAKHCLKKGS